ncbi:HDOD domain-containing protein [Holdemanella sp.]|uniref:HDOD domain-containing protein n=1 Tax=Holdemanella sp. TaxID=1971762 RepID=UPI003AF09192
MLPTREEALKLIRDGLLFNPGPWGEHCLTAAHCAEKIASACGDMDVEKAYILGLLHDIGRKFDVTDEELIIIKTELAKTIYDEYDRLIQLCDCLAGAEGVLDIENRMNDVKKRYGFYPQDKWNSNMNLKQYFEGKMNKDIYLICEKDTFAPGNL